MSLSSRIQVLVRHRDPISQAGLQSVFGAFPDLELVSNASSQDDGETRSASQKTADVVVADYEQAMAMAAEAEREGRKNPARGLIVITGSDREVDIRQALGHQIRGYLLTGCALEELASAVREVHRGGRYLSAAVAQRLAESLGTEPLTTRESEVLQRLVGGLCNKEIARKLNIGVGTVKSHLKTIFEKLGVESRTQAVAVADRRGLFGAANSPAELATARAA